LILRPAGRLDSGVRAHIVNHPLDQLEYVATTTQILSAFQTLEFALKVYIASAHKVISVRLNGDLPYKYSMKSVKKLPLKNLLGVFQNLSDNVALAKRIEKLCEIRNDVAHQALLVRHAELADILGQTMDKRHIDLKEAYAEVDSCHMDLNSELAKVFALLPKASGP
jgi:hypothetical protein